MRGNHSSCVIHRSVSASPSEVSYGESRVTGVMVMRSLVGVMVMRSLVGVMVMRSLVGVMVMRSYLVLW